MKSPPGAGFYFAPELLFNPDDFSYFSRMAERLPKGEKILRGIAVSDGVCRGKILVLGRERPTIAQRQVTDDGVAEEVNRLD